MVTLSEAKKGITSIPGFVEQYGLTGGLSRFAGIAYHRATKDITGRSIFDEQWDVCVILDACRADELAKQRHEFEWIEQVDQFPSLASCTWDWLPRTLDGTPEKVLKNTTYVSANPFSGEFCSRNQFYELDEVWRYAWDEHRGTVRPRPVTDRAIHHWRNTDTPRLLVHYVQPHVPFLSSGAQTLSRANFDHEEDSVFDAWDRVTRGQLPRETATGMYRETLNEVLQDVDLLLSNLQAERVVITADHGEAFGEWGLYGHPEKIDLPCLTQVPWVVTSGENKRTHEPSDYERTSNEVSRSEQLEALGYAE